MAKKARDIVRFFLGSYTPPGFLKVIADALKKAGAFFADQWKNHRVRFCVMAAVLCLILAGFAAFNFIQSRLPQPINIDYRVQAPGTTGDPESRPDLTVFFMGSAATLEMEDNEVPAGMIAINPPIEGVWRWSEDDTLSFSTEQTWRIGKRYTVTFAKGFFPSHIKTNNSFHFNIEDFSAQIIGSEFYIDPEDSAVKRALFTVQANYPLDTASLEKNISIEPQINADSGSLKKRPHLFSLTYNEDRTYAYIVSEPLGTPAKTIQMRLLISAGVRDANGEGKASGKQSASVEIPGMTSFVRVNDMSHELVKNDKQIYDQVLVMETRGTIDSAELEKNVAAWILPKDLPELPGLKGQKNYYWGSVDEIVPEVLALSTKAALEALPNEIKYSSTNSWKFEAEPGQFLYFKLNEGTRFYGGYVLAEPYENIFQVKDFPQELAILSEGSILSFSGDKRLSIMSRGIKDVEFNIGRIRPDDINHLVSQISGDVSNISFRNYNFNQYNITEQYTESAVVPVASERDIGYFSFDFSRYLDNIPNRNLRHG
ncbi:MAG: hypothetical protein LBU85_01535, partial [Treponema sp.]|nr:hypothetical protein [Treponema sp.]